VPTRGSGTQAPTDATDDPALAAAAVTPSPPLALAYRMAGAIRAEALGDP
jgi:hypothetical protein